MPRAIVFLSLTLLFIALAIHPAYGFFPSIRAESLSLLEEYRVYDPMLKNTELLASFASDAQGMPYGRILSPPSGAHDSRVIKITGMTAHIPDGHYIILAVDMEKHRICFPKWPDIESNAAFHTEIYEGCPVGECTVSLYAVDEAYYRKIKGWLHQKQTGGMPLIPSQYRLDVVRIVVRTR